MILDKLLEKKDLLIYIDTRIKYLRRQKRKALESAPPKKRAILFERFHGRIMELQYLKKHVSNLKDTAKRYWRRTIDVRDDKE